MLSGENNSQKGSSRLKAHVFICSRCSRFCISNGMCSLCLSQQSFMVSYVHAALGRPTLLFSTCCGRSVLVANVAWCCGWRVVSRSSDDMAYTVFFVCLLKCHLMDEWFHHLRLHPFPDLHVYILFGWCLFDQYTLSTFSTCSWRTFPLKRIKFSCRGLCGLQCFQAVQEFWTLEFSICLTLGLVSRTGSVSLVIIGIVMHCLFWLKPPQSYSHVVSVSHILYKPCIWVSTCPFLEQSAIQAKKMHCLWNTPIYFSFGIHPFVDLSS